MFEGKLEEARNYLDRDEPFWCDDFTRPSDQEFEKYLVSKGYDIYYLYFIEGWEGVYAPKSFQPKDLRKMSLSRSKLREAGVDEGDLPANL